MVENAVNSRVFAVFSIFLKAAADPHLVSSATVAGIAVQGTILTQTSLPKFLTHQTICSTNRI